MPRGDDFVLILRLEYLSYVHLSELRGRFAGGMHMSTFGSVFELSWLSGTDGFQINGEVASDRAGGSVASAGDVNGDGFDDLIIGADLADPNGNSSGASYVVFGAAGGFSASFDLSALTGTNGFQINGEAEFDLSGDSVASAGDVNGDGFDDLIIGAQYDNLNGDNSGASYVVFGAADGFSASLELSALNGTNGFRINGEAADDRAGVCVASAGDVNDDGFDDLIIGTRCADPNGMGSGAAYVVFGSGSGLSASFELSDLNGTNGFKINGEATGDYAGQTVASAGDVNGDGIDDLIIGARWAQPNGNYSGATYVVFGSASAFDASLELSDLDGTNGFKINVQAGDYTGVSVSSAGDVNGDGIDDLIIGATYASPNGTASGASYIVFGSGAGFSATLELSDLDGSNGFKINGKAEYDYSGASVASAGDVNGDGYDDLIIGASNADPNGNRSGASYVVFGTASGFSASLDLSDLDGTNGFQINGEAADDRASFSVAAAGDVNGDGYDDLIVGAGGADPNGSNSGASYIIFGKATQATTGDDELTGAGGAETISGLDGDDTLLGMAGNDQLFGGADDDSLGGGAGNDSLDGGANNDSLIGAAGADTIIGATGNDSLDGGAGDDSITGGSGSDTIIGEVGNDTVDGGAGADRLPGGSGSDTMIGGGDNDTITGGAGRDGLTGGLNNDVFKFTAMNEMTLREATTDRITDFKRGQDKIDLSTIDASTVMTTDDAFIFRGSKELKENNAGEINFKKFDNKGTTNDYTLVYIDTDTDRAAEGVIKVMGLHDFTAADFIL